MIKPDFKSTLKEDRVFHPSKKFSANAHIKNMAEYTKLYNESIKKPEVFWAREAENLEWFKKWDNVLEWKQPFAKWFSGGKINCSYNCLDRHLSDKGTQSAIIWDGENGDKRNITYNELHEEVCKLANVLKGFKVKKGDRVVIYLPMIPEVAIAMLACTRIGAIHSVVFGGYSSEALKVRINDARAKVVITVDGGYRKGNKTRMKDAVDEALSGVKFVKNVIVVKRNGIKVQMKKDRDFLYGDLMKKASSVCQPAKMNAEDPLFVLYTSGTTGIPKGVVHTHGGYLTQVAMSAKYIFDLHPNDKFWCTADVGWITGHSYVVYGPLLNGVTTIVTEGLPTHPTPERPWKLIDKHKITQFYTAPTAIRMFMKIGRAWPARHKLKSLKVIGTVGEPINPEAWTWYYNNIGKRRCPVVDTWWQTETGSILVTSLPGATPTKPGSATLPFFGVDVAVVDMKGKKTKVNEGGYLVINKPWPSMLRTVYKNDERYKKTYWNEIKGVYFSGDGARRDKDGYIWIMGRTDDIIKVAGHRLGTMEIESALVSHKAVAEAAVVGKQDEIKGEAIVAFVSLNLKFTESEKLINELGAHVVKCIGPIARPSQIIVVDDLPKTRSGKIIRRILKSIAEGNEIKGDTSTIANADILEKLKKL
ncbi:acetate--CoA ligase [Patescibacteria group bacterium]|nr:acetate--CoA ligase [Patescibacteria group bacterium]